MFPNTETPRKGEPTSPRPRRIQAGCALMIPSTVQRPFPVMERPLLPDLTERIINFTYNYLPGASAPCYDPIERHPLAQRQAEEVHPETPDRPSPESRLPSTRTPTKGKGDGSPASMKTVSIRLNLDEDNDEPIAKVSSRLSSTRRPESRDATQTDMPSDPKKEPETPERSSSSVRRSLSRRGSSKAGVEGNSAMISYYHVADDDLEASPRSPKDASASQEQPRISLARRSSSSAESAMPVHPTNNDEDRESVRSSPKPVNDEERQRRLSFRPTTENKVQMEPTTPQQGETSIMLEPRSTSSGSKSATDLPLLRAKTNSNAATSEDKDRPASFQLDQPAYELVPPATPRPASFRLRETSSAGVQDQQPLPQVVIHNPRGNQDSRLGAAIRLLVVLVFSFFLFLCLYYDGFSPLTEHGRPQTFSFRATFWPGYAFRLTSSVTCGEDAVDCRPFSTSDTWFGGHCLGQGFKSSGVKPFVRGGGQNTPFYTADSHICFAAIHAGVIQEEEGGCFEARFAGPKDFYNGTVQNGVKSQQFGWFPRSVEFRPVQDGRRCIDSRWSSDLVVALGFFCLTVLWRIDAQWLNHVAAQWGFYYAGLSTAKASGDFWPMINELSNKEFTLVPMCFFLFHFFGNPGFCPDPKRFPLDALLFFCTFFWAFMHIQDYSDDFQANFTFTAKGLSSLSVGSIVILALIGAFALPLGILQARVLFRAGVVPSYLFGLMALVLYLATIALAGEPGMFSYHLHHYFVGLLLCFCGRGQHRYSVIIQAIGLALFVEGLAVYDTDPFFDLKRLPSVGYEVGNGYKQIVQSPVFTRAELYMNEDPPRVVLEWTLPSALVANWTCSDETVDLIPGIARAKSRRMRRRLQDSRPMTGNNLGFFSQDIPDDSSDTDPPVPIPLGSTIESVLDPDITPAQYRPEEFNFYVARNGILMPGIYHGSFNVSIPLSPGSNQFTAENPLVFTVAMTGTMAGTSPLSFRIPMPFPLLDSETSLPVAYHALNASFCERMAGIYTKLRMNYSDQFESSFWWNDGT